MLFGWGPACWSREYAMLFECTVIVRSPRRHVYLGPVHQKHAPPVSDHRLWPPQQILVARQLDARHMQHVEAVAPGAAVIHEQRATDPRVFLAPGAVANSLSPPVFTQHLDPGAAQIDEAADDGAPIHVCPIIGVEHGEPERLVHPAQVDAGPHHAGRRGAQTTTLPQRGHTRQASPVIQHVVIIARRHIPTPTQGEEHVVPVANTHVEGVPATHIYLGDPHGSDAGWQLRDHKEAARCRIRADDARRWLLLDRQGRECPVR